MYLLRRISLITLIIVVMISIFQDLANESNPVETSVYKTEKELPHFDAVPVKVNPGDTVLSITEEIQTEPTQELSTEMILSAFQSLNPTIQPTQIHVHEVYYFPKFTSP